MARGTALDPLRFRVHDGTVVELVGGREADVVLLAVFRDLVDEHRIPDLVAFCSHDFSIEQLRILLRAMDGREEPAFTRLSVTNRGGVLHVHVETPNLTAGYGEAILRGSVLPQTLVSGSAGMDLRVRDIVDHPYLPPDLPIGHLRQTDEGVIFRIEAPPRPYNPNNRSR